MSRLKTLREYVDAEINKMEEPDKGYILIDDMERNIKEWNEMGGTGIVNVDADHTMELLRDLEIL